MNTKTIMTSIAIAIIVLGTTSIASTSQKVFAPSSDLQIIGVNKLSSNDISACENIRDQAVKVGGGAGTNLIGVTSCSGVPTDGTTYSKNTASPAMLIAKSSLQNNDQIRVRMYDIAQDEESAVLDEYIYTVHDIDTIDEVQIRLCSGATTDHICSTRVIFEG